MLPTNADLFLPISGPTLDRVLAQTPDVENDTANLDVAQVAALIVLQYLPKLKETRQPRPIASLPRRSRAAMRR